MKPKIKVSMPIEQSSLSLLIDIDFLETRREISDSFLREMVDVFNLEAPELITRIKKEHRNNNIAAIRNLGHKLKGMSQNMGAVYLSEIAESIEQGTPEVIRPMIECLDVVYEKTRHILNKLVLD